MLGLKLNHDNKGFPDKQQTSSTYLMLPVYSASAPECLNKLAKDSEDN